MKLWIIIGVIVVLGSIGSCIDSHDGPDGKYTPEECVALSLSASSGNSDSAAEWSLHCQ